MKNLVEKYNKLTLKGRNTFWMIIIGIIGTIILLPWCFLSNPGLSLGFLFGSLIEIGCYRLIVLTSDVMTKSATENVKSSVLIFSTLGFGIRFILYAAGLVLAALDTFKWKTNTLSVWTTFAAYMPMAIIVAVTTLKANAKESK